MKRKTPYLLAGLAVCSAGILLLALCGGSSWYAPTELFSPELEVIFDLRLRRVLTAFLVGAALAAGGTACQAVLRNELADPYILGISGGASLGAALAILSGAVVHSVWALPGGAFCGALTALALVSVPANRLTTIIRHRSQEIVRFVMFHFPSFLKIRMVSFYHNPEKNQAFT